jgi:PleD family two-component response regulator
VGKLLLGTLRSTDVPVRYGGDEFVLLLPETSKDQAVDAASRIRAEIAATPFLQEASFGPVRITASLGVATFPDDAQSPEALIARADAAMYLVKQGRRDGVLAAPPAGLPTVPRATEEPALPTPGGARRAEHPVEPSVGRNGTSPVGVSS